MDPYVILMFSPGALFPEGEPARANPLEDERAPGAEMSRPSEAIPDQPAPADISCTWPVDLGTILKVYCVLQRFCGSLALTLLWQ